jgi:hypothetical protein
MVEVQTQIDKYAVFVLQAECDEAWVEENLAERLKDEEGLLPHFFKWNSIPGNSKQQTMQDGFDNSVSCAICFGAGGLGGIEEMMRQAATARKGANPKYRLIPVLLPDYDPATHSLPEILRDIEKVDFSGSKDFDEQFYRLVCGIKGVSPGPWKPKSKDGSSQTGNISESAHEKYKKAFLELLDMVNEGEEKKRLDKEEAKNFRALAFDNIMKQMNQRFDVSEVTVQGSRAEKP